MQDPQFFIADLAAAEEAPVVDYVLEAIDRLLDAMEGLHAPVTRELLSAAMMALVHECALAPAAPLQQPPAGVVCH